MAEGSNTELLPDVVWVNSRLAKGVGAVVLTADYDQTDDNDVPYYRRLSPEEARAKAHEIVAWFNRECQPLHSKPAEALIDRITEALGAK